MLRRSHRKSRGGCLECKRRHVKCDENRPVCRLCAVSDRDCSYPLTALHRRCGNTETSSQDLLPSSFCDDGPKAVVSQESALLTPNANIDSPVCPLPSNHNNDDTEPEINFDHMELLVHATQDSSIFNLSGVYSDHALGLALGLKEALKAPYLMHELLAFSAQHLAFIHPEKSKHYLHQAMVLQTRAVSLFNSSWTHVNDSNCVAVLLFSSVLGHHLLAETLHGRHADGLDGFISRYIQCIEMHRGIYTIATSAWPLLMSSEIEPILTRSANFTSREPTGNDCAELKKLIESTTSLSWEEKLSCQRAIDYLQVGFDAVAETGEAVVHRHQMIYSWTLLVKPELTRLLAKKQPEALVILAYYAVLLHHGRSQWQVGKTGESVFGLIENHLGSAGDDWLRIPRLIIKQTIVPAHAI
ncbi:hypothetical protein FB567DRAFT_157700 [Paraphoma chrysanthemicola]|uniref:Zn(2)-C6 fungal-type domain-containing protein n=1 Tax=Paraphoma chrysanthemicola TaxID=798071 RepID=A0A8K0VUZ1_9PLEO|nr:hypothetical protein FB567DRAFT_157700 [Paraphoma chrysanthemicola]